MVRRFVLILGIVAGLMLTGPGVAAATSGGSVHGRGVVFLPAPFIGDRAELKINARTKDEGVRGHFHMLHTNIQTGAVRADIEGYVDCLVVTGNKAVVTGVITSGTDPFGNNAIGHEVSYTIVEGDPDTLAFGYAFFPGAIKPCQSISPGAPGTAGFNRPVTKGHFTVHDWANDPLDGDDVSA